METDMARERLGNLTPTLATRLAVAAEEDWTSCMLADALPVLLCIELLGPG